MDRIEARKCAAQLYWYRFRQIGLKFDIASVRLLWMVGWVRLRALNEEADMFEYNTIAK